MPNSLVGIIAGSTLANATTVSVNYLVIAGGGGGGND